ncbi:hypothetical protein SLS58_010338 [Diplodia intermedia]|uniref:Uncharacterized protein n=1 Tax=Diplodia intermedia TaxID=856260 RepID=A0ABR3T6Y5_9PEZI
MRLSTAIALLGGAAAITADDPKPVEHYYMGPLVIYDNTKDAIDFAMFTLPRVDVMCFGNRTQLAEGTGGCNNGKYRFGLAGSLNGGWREYSLTVWKGAFDTRHNMNVTLWGEVKFRPANCQTFGTYGGTDWGKHMFCIHGYNKPPMGLPLYVE